MKKPKVIVILGQTATGKSALAVKIAKKLGGEIISADSRQIYTGLDIGTGKITKKEMRGVPHHLLDVADPKKKFTVVEYQEKAIRAIARIIERGKVPIICGGTGFYIDAITKGVIFPKVPPNLKLRKSLEKKTAQALFKILEKLDSRRAKDIHKKNEKQNKIRLIRAIEIAKALGGVPKIAEIKPAYQFIKVGVRLPQDKLNKKIEKRVGEMFKMGLMKEISKLKKLGLRESRLRELGFEYYKPTHDKVLSETIKYSKRQMTWFKRDKKIRWFLPSETKQIEKYLKLKT